MRLGQVDLDEAKYHVQVIWIVRVLVFRWEDDVFTRIGRQSLKCI